MAVSSDHKPDCDASFADPATDPLLTLQRHVRVAAQLGFSVHLLSGRHDLQALHRATVAQGRVRRATALHALLQGNQPVHNPAPFNNGTASEPEAMSTAPIAKASVATGNGNILFIGGDVFSSPPSPASPQLVHPSRTHTLSDQEQLQPQYSQSLEEPLLPAPHQQQQRSATGSIPITLAVRGGVLATAGCKLQPTFISQQQVAAAAAATVPQGTWGALLHAAIDYWQHESAYLSASHGTADEAKAHTRMQASRKGLAAAADRIDPVQVVDELLAVRPSAAGAPAAEIHNRQQRTLFGPLLDMQQANATASQQRQADLLIARMTLLIAIHGKLARSVPKISAPTPSSYLEQPPRDKDQQQPDTSAAPGRESSRKKRQQLQQQKKRQQQQREPQPQQTHRERGEFSKTTGSTEGSSAATAAAATTYEESVKDTEGPQGSGACGGKDVEVWRLETASVLVDGLLRYAGMPPMLYHEMQLLATVLSDLQDLTLVPAEAVVSGLPPSLAELSSLKGLCRAVHCMSTIASRSLSTGLEDWQRCYLIQLSLIHTRAVKMAVQAAKEAALSAVSASVAAAAKGQPAASTAVATVAAMATAMIPRQSLQQLYEAAMQKIQRYSESRSAENEVIARRFDGFSQAQALFLLKTLLYGEYCSVLPAAVFAGDSRSSGIGAGGPSSQALVVSCEDCGEDEARLRVARVLLAALGAAETEATARSSKPTTPSGEADAGAAAAAVAKPASLVAVGQRAIHVILTRTAAVSAVLGARAATEAGVTGSGGSGPLLLSILCSRQLTAQISDSISGVDVSTCRSADKAARFQERICNVMELSAPRVAALSFTAGTPEVFTWLRHAQLHAPRLVPVCTSRDDVTQLRAELARHLDEQHAAVVRCRKPDVLAAVVSMLGELHVEFIRHGRGLVVVPAPLALTLERQEPGKGCEGEVEAFGGTSRSTDAFSSAPEFQKDRLLLQEAAERVLRVAAADVSGPGAAAGAAGTPVLAAEAAASGGGGSIGLELSLRPGLQTRQRMAVTAATCLLFGMGWIQGQKPEESSDSSTSGSSSSDGGYVEEVRLENPKHGFLKSPMGQVLELDLVVAECAIGKPTAPLPVKVPSISPPLMPSSLSSPSAVVESNVSGPKPQEPKRSLFSLVGCIRRTLPVVEMKANA